MRGEYILYITFIESTFKEYPFNGTYLSPTIEEAKEYATEIMGDIRDNTPNKRQSRFAGFVINKISTEKKMNFGFGVGEEHVAVECMEKEEYDAQVLGTKEYLEARIEIEKERLNKLKKQYSELS